MGATLGDADLSGADLTDADLSGENLAEVNLSGARWPEHWRVPEGWKLDTGSGRLERADGAQKGGSSE